MKYFVTGATGKLGGAITRLLREQGAEVSGLDIRSGGDESMAEGSFCDAELLRRLLPGIEVVFHTASLHGGQRNTHSPAEFIRTNVEGFVTLLECCLEAGVKRVVFSSSMEVIIGKNWKANGLALHDESTPPRPDWIYPVTKLQGEVLGEYYWRRYGLQFVALRYMNINENEPSLQLLGRGNAKDDVARANILAATVPFIGYEMMHIGPESPISNEDMIDAAEDPWGVMGRHWPEAPDLLRRHKIDLDWKWLWPRTKIDRARTILGWRPQVTFETYLAELAKTTPAQEPLPVSD